MTHYSYFPERLQRIEDALVVSKSLLLMLQTHLSAEAKAVVVDRDESDLTLGDLITCALDEEGMKYVS